MSINNTKNNILNQGGTTSTAMVVMVYADYEVISRFQFGDVFHILEVICHQLTSHDI